MHNGPALEGIEATLGLGCHWSRRWTRRFTPRSHPRAWRYAIPELAGVRRYGFHGWSHRYVTERYAALAGSAEPTIITLHLGGGCSAAAILRGRSVDTSMGYSPLEGLVMGTRAGDLDPGILTHLLHEGMSLPQLERMLQHGGRTQGAGRHGRRAGAAGAQRRRGRARARDVLLPHPEVRGRLPRRAGRGGGHRVHRRDRGERAGDSAASVRAVRLGRADARRRAKPRATRLRISAEGSRLAAYAIPTDEEYLIARETFRLMASHESP